MIKLLLFLLLISAKSFGALKVVTTTTNLQSIVKEIGKELVDVTSITKGVQDPHFIEAKPTFIRRLVDADLLISIGAGLEQGWLPLLISGSRKSHFLNGASRHLVVSDRLNLIDKVGPEHLTRASGDVHPEGNPHFLISPSYSISVAKNITEKLKNLSSDNAQYFEKNFLLYKSKVQEIIKSIQKNTPKDFKVITYHKTLSYYFNEFGIESVNVLEPKPGVPPTASHILQVIKDIQKHNVKLILVENYYDLNIARRIKEKLPMVEVKSIPVAVHGNKDISDIYLFYELLGKEIR